jgi:hypothetical protein
MWALTIYLKYVSGSPQCWTQRLAENWHEGPTFSAESQRSAENWHDGLTFCAELESIGRFKVPTKSHGCLISFLEKNPSWFFIVLNQKET